MSKSSSIPTDPELILRRLEQAYRQRPTLPVPPSEEETPPEVIWLDWLATPVTTPAPVPRSLLMRMKGAKVGSVPWWRRKYVKKAWVIKELWKFDHNKWKWRLITRTKPEWMGGRQARQWEARSLRLKPHYHPQAKAWNAKRRKWTRAGSPDYPFHPFRDA